MHVNYAIFSIGDNAIAIMHELSWYFLVSPIRKATTTFMMQTLPFLGVVLIRDFTVLKQRPFTQYWT